MRKLFILSLLLMTFYHSNAQELLMDTEDVHSPDVKNPEFQGGDVTAFHEFIITNLDKSKILKEGQLVCSFTVNEEGELKNIRVVKDLGGESAFELIRVLRLSPKWKPAMRNGKPFATTVNLPFTFTRTKQNNGSKDNAPKARIPVDVSHEFEGGMKAFQDYVFKKLKASGKSGTIKIVVSFTVVEDGSLEEIKILKSNYSEINDQLIKILESCPKWKKAQNTTKTETQFTLPITIQNI